ncbi:membrane-associated phospholipid phosphatase [Saccharopolyspora lacisalsi]|uniref:Membrane-associated phospholipid phosphatase n=1 Tax=Halosaccharopolyspora lacisalsi TaxID=1000566 RepID=A0A839E030_9PSEU|nr:phosphatase PAP2 family protein [Halosaccharopolyspora lacisalsi]MBA8827552.1 membrane-associated phospholipid phosphatase [Halosaccharopolyspora lacisalsi]
MAELTTAPAPEQDPAANTEPPESGEPQVTPETVAVRRVQEALARPPMVTTAQAMSKFGDHAIGWLAIGAVGALVDRKQRGRWVAAAAGVAFAHGASIGVKRTVRRPRPGDPSIRVLVDTPSKLSFPSSHSTSTTAAAVLYGSLLGKRLTPVLVPPMMVSRLVLGVHYPSDVLAGTTLGSAVALGLRRYMKRRRNRG